MVGGIGEVVEVVVVECSVDGVSSHAFASNSAQKRKFITCFYTC